MFVKLLYFLFFVSLGVAILKYRKIVFEWTGQWYWAEKHIWRGGTLLVITLIGLGMIFFWVGYPLWAFDSFKDGGGRSVPPGLEGEARPPADQAPAPDAQWQ